MDIGYWIIREWSRNTLGMMPASAAPRFAIVVSSDGAAPAPGCYCWWGTNGGEWGHGERSSPSL